MSVLGRRLALVSRDLLGMSSVCACRGENTITATMICLFLQENTLLFTLSFLGRNTSTLSEVGQLEALRLQGNYDTGQMFLHKVNRPRQKSVKYKFCVRCLVIVEWFSSPGLQECTTETCLQSLPTPGLWVRANLCFFYNIWISGKGFWTQTVLISPPPPGIFQIQPSFVLN